MKLRQTLVSHYTQYVSNTNVVRNTRIFQCLELKLTTSIKVLSFSLNKKQ